MGLGDGVLEFPPLLRLLREGDELFTSRNGEDAKVLVLCAVLELDWPFPGREIRPARRKADVDDVWKGELLEQLCALSLVDADASGNGVGEEATIRAVLVCAGGDVWRLEAIDGVVVRRTTNEADALLCTV